MTLFIFLEHGLGVGMGHMSRSIDHSPSIYSANTATVHMPSEEQKDMIKVSNRLNKLTNDEVKIKNRVNLLETEQKRILKKVEETRVKA